MSSRSTLVIAIIVVLILVFANSVYVINAKERAVLLRFGKVVKADLKPGLHFKIPVVNNVRKFNGRAIILDTGVQRYLTQEKKALDVDAFIIWRVIDVQKYYTATAGNAITAANILRPRVDQGLRNEFSTRTLREVVSGQRDELMNNLTKELNRTSQQDLGVEILDIRIKRIDLPGSVRTSVFSRMEAERERIATELRSQGKEVAEGIRADADRQKAIIVANAYKQAEIIRGEGDQKAADVYAKAYNQDPDFYQFYRSLNAYQHAFNKPNDILVLQPEGSFFKYFTNPQGKSSEK